MHNQLFSDVWKMDRCIEASWVVSLLVDPLILLFVLFVFLFLIFAVTKKPVTWFIALVKPKPSASRLVAAAIFSIIASVLLVIPILFVVQFSAIVVGFLIFNCDRNPLWDQVRPAHEMHATLKKIREDGGATPKNVSEFVLINPKAHQKLQEENVEFVYEYHQADNGYRFTFRPSKYLVVDFSDENDFILYRTESIISPHLFKDNPLLE